MKIMYLWYQINFLILSVLVISILHFGYFEGHFWYFDHFYLAFMHSIVITQSWIALPIYGNYFFSLSLHVTVSNCNQNNHNNWNHCSKNNYQSRLSLIIWWIIWIWICVWIKNNTILVESMNLCTYT